ncbi:hypothetical protein KPL74_04970 [Bacillus sp. NP157]|nr:hypothetical protein KPL74_04970 [Bacillus sp. NP157]
MKTYFLAMLAVCATAGCSDSQVQAIKDAGYLMRMNGLVCHFAATEMTKVNTWLDEVIKEHPALAEYARKGAAEADAVAERHKAASDGQQLNIAECNNVHAMAMKWPG